MKMIDYSAYIEQARSILSDNDLGSYTVPTHGLYPFQWNWDSCLTALGQWHFDEDRAWREIETLFEHQWDDGMVPHIIFHKEDDGYFPGPEVYGTNRPVPTSGLTQPPVAGFVVRRLVERARNREDVKSRAAALLPKIKAWHDWFYRCRDPQGTGLVAILHPWETGRDNAIDWDEALLRVPTEGVGSFVRRDTNHANPDHRPTDEEYRRYISLVQTFRELGWDNDKLHEASPFCIVDPGFNAILLRSATDLAALADQLGDPTMAKDCRRQVEHGLAALESLWSDHHSQYLCFDRRTGALIDSASVGGILPVFADIPTQRASQLVERINILKERCRFLVPSHDPLDPRFEHLRYWRGPAWLIVNYMISDGLANASRANTARSIVNDCLALIETSGFAEYYSPVDGTPCGGSHFTWTAAMVIEFLKNEDLLPDQIAS
ncbi:MAG: trehalase family glycosidase [Pseudomonadota bacterium]